MKTGPASLSRSATGELSLSRSPTGEVGGGLSVVYQLLHKFAVWTSWFRLEAVSCVGEKGARDKKHLGTFSAWIPIHSEGLVGSQRFQTGVFQLSGLRFLCPSIDLVKPQADPPLSVRALLTWHFIFYFVCEHPVYAGRRSGTRTLMHVA